MTRWKPQRYLRYRRPRWRHRGRLCRQTPRLPIPVQEVGITLVAGRNNLWGMGYLGGRLAWSLSAGSTPPGAGSHRGGRQAATAVVARVGEWSTTAVVPFTYRARPRLRRFRPKRAYRQYRLRFRRRWRVRTFVSGRLTRVATLALKLIGLVGRVRWKQFLTLLYPYTGRYTRRVTISAAFVRPHNGIRPAKDRRI